MRSWSAAVERGGFVTTPWRTYLRHKEDATEEQGQEIRRREQVVHDGDWWRVQSVAGLGEQASDSGRVFSPWTVKSTDTHVKSRKDHSA